MDGSAPPHVCCPRGRAPLPAAGKNLSLEQGWAFLRVILRDANRVLSHQAQDSRTIISQPVEALSVFPSLRGLRKPSLKKLGFRRSGFRLLVKQRQEFNQFS